MIEDHFFESTAPAAARVFACGKKLLSSMGFKVSKPTVTPLGFDGLEAFKKVICGSLF